jgi:hypothetical protein
MNRYCSMKYVPVWLMMGFLALYSCKSSGEKQPDISGVKAEARLLRFDEDFFAMDSSNIAVRLPQLQSKYGKVLEYFQFKTFMADQMQRGGNAVDVTADFLRRYRSLYDTCRQRFAKTDWLQKELETAFRYTKYYFPAFKPPPVYTFVDGFYPDNPESFFGVEYSADTVIISLPMFLGAGFTGYDPQYYFDYLRRRFEPVYITRNVMKAVVDEIFPKRTPPNLLGQMIDAGKRLYVLDKVLPGTDDAVLLGYTKQQLDDCLKQEKTIWSFFVQGNLLYVTDPGICREYIGENPYTKELGTDSPGNIGAFAGWQIVKKYMAAQKDLSMEQLIATDANTIFQEAKYKP